MADEHMSDDEEITTIASPEVVDKYKNAAKITNAAIQYVASLCQPGANVLSICQAGDDYINAEAAKIYGKKKFLKGVSFPTCISVNNVACNFSPLVNDTPIVIAEGDVVKM